MRKIILYILFFIDFFNPALSYETQYILHDGCINVLYELAQQYFYRDEIYILRDPRGIVLRFPIKFPYKEYKELSFNNQNKLIKIGEFLAKIKNPVIIEVHTAKNSFKNSYNEKNWEISAVLAGNIERVIIHNQSALNNRIYSVGYGEFLPENNTPNNGGKFLNRVDIIILCNISGE